MANQIEQLVLTLTDYRYLVAIIAFGLWLIFCWLFIKYFDKFVEKIVKQTTTKVDNIILNEAQLPLWVIMIIIGFFVISRTVGLPSKITPYIDRFSQLATIFIIVYFAIRVFSNLLRLASRRNDGLANMTPTFSRMANILVWGIGILMLMDIFGISLTPMLASLGIAGLAVGLALQETLSNFFSGVYILISQPVRIGDYIELENGLKGYVISIGWRETRIKMLQNNTVVIPNAKLAQSVITNYYMPDKEMACLVQVGVHYESDLEKVERVTVEVGKQVMEKVNGGIISFVPFIRYHTFSNSSINFTVILRVTEFVDQYLVTHEFIKALSKRYKEEGIVIPFPIRTLDISPATAKALRGI
ncbi:MAG: mechanosensitive ion channel family protein [bacterium]